MIVCVCCFSMSTRETGEMTLLFLRMARSYDSHKSLSEWYYIIVCVCCFSMSTRETGEMTLLFLRMAHTTHARACQSGTILLFVFVVLACRPERQER